MEFDLVFEGGGAKGMVFVGAMKEFERRGHKPGRLIGTSAGAITATLLAAGYSSAEMQEALGEKLKDGKSVFTGFMAAPTPFTKDEVQKSAIRALLKNIDLSFVPNFVEDKFDDLIAEKLATDLRLCHIFSFVERGGWFSADNFLSWIHARLNSGQYKGQPRNFGDMTLEQLYGVTKTDLSLVASDITGGNMLVLNARTAPQLPVIWAVRMSMSIPLLWQEVVWLPGWGKYRDRDVTGHAIVDGGLLSNFPIELFLSSDKNVTEVMGEKHPDHDVLGFLIDEEMDVPGLPQAIAAVEKKKFEFGELETVKRISNLANTALSARDKMVIDAFDRYVARMPARGYGTTEFDMTEERRQILVDAGQNEMEKYFAKRQLMEDNPNFAILEEPSAEDVADRIAKNILR